MEKQPLYHDSHDMRYRAPFGAVRVGQEVTLRMGILDGFYVSLPRVRIRTPTFSNIMPLLAMLPGCQLADVPVIALSIDPCISCTER